MVQIMENSYYVMSSQDLSHPKAKGNSNLIPILIHLYYVTYPHAEDYDIILWVLLEFTPV